ncbi:hypothetical protein NHQ30_011273 [Ciborinia camelliae]|nr:hypothetical protein NHQ30_011273 [Ciborinia camelliae]
MKLCPNGHTIKSKCHEDLSSKSCPTCKKEKQEAEQEAKKELDEQLRRDEMMLKHQKELEKVQREIDKTQQEIQDARLRSEQQAVLAEKKKDLSVMEHRLEQMKSNPPLHPSPPPPHFTPSAMVNTSPSPMVTSLNPPQPDTPILPNLAEKKGNLRKHLQICLNHNSSASKSEWQRQKHQENERNPAIDKIMEMIGLEDVKSQVLRIKAKVDTSKRQGTDLKKERLGLILLGNPGTGMRLFIRKRFPIVPTAGRIIG